MEKVPRRILLISEHQIADVNVKHCQKTATRCGCDETTRLRVLMTRIPGGVYSVVLTCVKHIHIKLWGRVRPARDGAQPQRAQLPRVGAQPPTSPVDEEEMCLRRVLAGRAVGRERERETSAPRSPAQRKSICLATKALHRLTRTQESICLATKALHWLTRTQESICFAFPTRLRTKNLPKKRF